jgi:hypothetical protein
MNRPPTTWYRSRLLWGAASLLVLALVFASYLRPDVMVNLANLVWSCF